MCQNQRLGKCLCIGVPFLLLETLSHHVTVAHWRMSDLVGGDAQTWEQRWWIRWTACSHDLQIRSKLLFKPLKYSLAVIHNSKLRGRQRLRMPHTQLILQWLSWEGVGVFKLGILSPQIRTEASGSSALVFIQLSLNQNGQNWKAIVRAHYSVFLKCGIDIKGNRQKPR